LTLYNLVGLNPLSGGFAVDLVDPRLSAFPWTEVPSIEIPFNIDEKLCILAEERTFGPDASLLPLISRKNDARWGVEHARLRIEFSTAWARSDPTIDLIQVYRMLRDRESPEWFDHLLAIDEDDGLGAWGRRLFREVRRTIERYYFMAEQWHYVVATLFVLQAHVATRLRRVFYLFPAGNFGTGKTEFESRMAELTGGVVLIDFSPAYLARTLKKGATAIFDEWGDSGNPEQESSKSALLRVGYKSDAKAYGRIDGKTGQPVEFQVYGPKMVAYRGGLDDALQSRGFPIPTVKPKGESGWQYVIDNMYPEMGDLPQRLASWGAAVCAAYPDERLKEIVFSEPFRVKVKASVEELGANRDSELTATALLVAEMAGVNVVAELQTASVAKNAAVVDASSDELADLAAAILAVARFGQRALDAKPGEVRLRQKTVKDTLNERLRRRGDRPISDRLFKTRRRAIGIEDAWLRTRSGNALTWVVPTAFLEQLAADYPADRGEGDGSVASDGSVSPQGRGTDPSYPSYPTGGPLPTAAPAVAATAFAQAELEEAERQTPERR
jgi:hypothetical protein